MPITRNAPAKINLGLHVLRRRKDGFHDLETVFCQIPWADTLSVRPADSITLTTNDSSLPTGESNLVVRAARVLAAESGTRKGAALHLEKRIPVGAGLGGGSSDAAATLRILAEMWALSVEDVVLHRLALALGSDVPFFMGAPCAYGAGRGELLQPLDGFQLPYSVVVAVPRLEVSTAAAFARIRPRDQSRADLRSLVRSLDLPRWRRELKNDFEEQVFSTYPEVGHAKDTLLNSGAAYASLTGTGAGVYGLFLRPQQALYSARLARQKGYVVWGP